MSKTCSWCGDYIIDDKPEVFDYVFENGKKYKSKEIFCSGKCRSKYPYLLKPDKPSIVGRILVGIIVIMFILVFIFG
jgi:hypothetical protein